MYNTPHTLTVNFPDVGLYDRSHSSTSTGANSSSSRSLSGASPGSPGSQQGSPGSPDPPGGTGGGGGVRMKKHLSVGARAEAEAKAAAAALVGSSGDAGGKGGEKTRQESTMQPQDLTGFMRKKGAKTSMFSQFKRRFFELNVEKEELTYDILFSVYSSVSILVCIDSITFNISVCMSVDLFRCAGVCVCTRALEIFLVLT